MIAAGATAPAGFAAARLTKALVTAETDFHAGTSVRMSRSHAAYPGLGGAAQDAGL
jgi:hypothetical protein